MDDFNVCLILDAIFFALFQGFFHNHPPSTDEFGQYSTPKKKKSPPNPANSPKMVHQIPHFGGM
jgi:hypothetical protein